MKDFIYKKFIVFLILLQPVIDIITSFMVMNNISVSIGILLKVFTMFLAFIYLVFIDDEHRKFNYLYLTFLFLFCTLNIFNNMFVIKIRFFEYFGYLVKFVYHLIMLLFFIRWYKKCGIKLYQLRTPIFIIVVTYFIALLTNTAFPSYTAESLKLGYSGWYSSANELSNLLCLLFPLALYNAFHNKDGIFFDKILFILTGICMLLIGTKAGLLGFYGVLVGYLLLRIILIRKKRLDLKFLFVALSIVVATSLYNYIPSIQNIILSMDKYGQVDKMVLSGRDEFLKEMKKKRKNIDNYDRFIGKSFIYGKTSNILIIEQDFYDIYFMYGTAGLALFIFLYVNVYYIFIKKIILYLRKPKLFSKKYFAVIVAVTLELCVAFIAGHSLMSPSVSTYLTLLVAMSVSIDIKKDTERKKSILVSYKSNFVNKIDESKYDVKYLVTDNSICNKENVCYPYFVNWKIMHIKFIKKLFFNRFMLFNLIRNQRFDYILGDNSTSFADTYFLRKSKADRRIVVGKKKDKYFKECISKMQINKL